LSTSTGPEESMRQAYWKPREISVLQYIIA
jgi:hypothetical protein